MYQRAICQEWVSRGYKDTCLDKTEVMVENVPQQEWQSPAWLGSYALHESHRSNLIRKFPEYYNQYWDTDDDLPYVWPTEELV